MTFEITTAVLTALVIGIVEIAKQIGLNTKYAGLLAVILGILATLGLSFFQVTTTVIFTGIVIGLSAAGLYSGAKALIKNE